MKNEYKNRLENLEINWEDEPVQEEFAVLDRAGRIQIPAELLQEMGIQGNKVKIELSDGKIVIEKPEK
jgi:AbrB family looped-hinge helix DNA binding protein